MEEQKTKNLKLKRSIKIILVVFFVLFVVLVISSLLYLNWIINYGDPDNSQKAFFEVNKNETTINIAERLESRDFIRSGWVFFVYAKIKGKNLMPGIYEIPKNSKIADVFDIISNGKTKIIKFTIPEGYRTEQIGQLLEEKNIADYADFLDKAKKYEGQLFPDTYYFSPDYSTDQIIETMRDNYNKKVLNKNVKPEDLIIASIVEREAIKDSERPIIAGVYKNRLAKNMKLEADPTVQYGKDDINTKYLSLSDKLNFHYWQKITSADYLKTKSEYNTYIINALPPGPICNPGIKSIEAAVNYTHHNYLYFLQNDGQIYLSETAAGHEKNIKEVFGR